MGAEVIQHKVIRVKVPDGKRVSRVRFLSDHPDCRPVEATWPWSHPWWCTGTYGKNGEEGCIIVAYTEDVDLLKKGWPEGRDFEIFDSGLEYYTYSVRYQPDDEFIKNKLPKVWGQWAHCGPNHKWQLIVREVRELLDDLLIDAKIEDVVSGVLPTPDPTVNDFRIWWVGDNYISKLARRHDGLGELPEYLAENIYELTADMEKGVDNNGVLLVHDDHDKYLNVTDEQRRHFNPTRVGIAFLVNDICCVRKHPGIITTMDGVVLETREFLPMGGMVSKF